MLAPKSATMSEVPHAEVVGVLYRNRARMPARGGPTRSQAVTSHPYGSAHESQHLNVRAIHSGLGPRADGRGSGGQYGMPPGEPSDVLMMARPRVSDGQGVRCPSLYEGEHRFNVVEKLSGAVWDRMAACPRVFAEYGTFHLTFTRQISTAKTQRSPKY